MNRNAIEPVLGAVVLVIAGLFLLFAFNSADIRTSGGYTITGRFSRADGLRPGSDVRVSGVKVGSVQSVTLDPDTFLATVAMNIDSNVSLPRDTIAVSTSDGIFGEKLVVLTPGSDEEKLKPNGRIEYTQAAPGLDQLIGQFIFSMQGNKNEQGGGAAPAGGAAAPGSGGTSGGLLGSGGGGPAPAPASGTASGG
jgi:phospholipid/cholesterol/gamma-HCH transport system substrate-binding protein